MVRASPTPGKIFGALIKEVRFAADSLLEETVWSEPVSERPKFPASRENAGNFVDSGVKGASKAAKKAAKSVFYELIPDAPEQGIFGARAGNLIGRSGNFSPRSGTPTKVT